jgi:hypothetical protein
MTEFVELTPLSGGRVYVNPAHVAIVCTQPGTGVAVLMFGGSTGLLPMEVKGNAREVAHRLGAHVSGE